jgi:hypothetical protein
MPRALYQLLTFACGHAVPACVALPDEALAAQTPPEDEDLEDLKVCVSRALLRFSIC